MLSDMPSSLVPVDATGEDVLYVADAQLNVVFVNTTWRSFADSNNGKPILGAAWNSNLLANFSGSARLRWQTIYEALLTGQLQTYEENFICSSPVERRTYRLRICRHLDQAGKISYLSHHAVHVDGKNEASILGERLRALDADPEAMVKAYQRLVAGRPVHSARLTTAQYLAPLQEVGGDLLWHRDWPDGGTDLVIADVMGHGTEAACLAAKIVLLLDAHADGSLTVAENVARLNRLLLELPRYVKADEWGPLFATGLFLRVDPTLQAVTLCSFGHAGPIFSMTGKIEPVAGPPVGIVANEKADAWPELQLRFTDHGRRFVIFTDGLTEQFNLAGEMIGEAGIKRAFLRAGSWPLPRMIDAIRAELDAFRGEAQVKDDQALLAAEVAAP